MQIERLKDIIQSANMNFILCYYEINSVLL